MHDDSYRNPPDELPSRALNNLRPISEHSIVHWIEGYTPVCLFARGGMAQVYLARTNTYPSRLVAIKTLQIHSLNDPERMAMFADEMRIARLLRHPNIVELVEAGVIEGEPYLVLEFIDGPSLRELADWAQERGQPLDPRVVMSLFVGACAGLHYAHELQSEWGTPLRLVHRDISPQNLMITRQGGIKVLDFGVAKAVGQRHNTVAQGVKGKMAYAAPEYVRGSVPDRRADIFGLGVVLWELLANKRLFFRSTAVATMQAVVYDPIPSLTLHNPSLPPKVARLVRTALDRDLDQRWPTAEALGQALVETLSELGGVMSPVEIAEALAEPLTALLPSEQELRPDMSDQALSRGATRPSLAAIPPVDEEDSDETNSSWSSVEVDLSALAEREEIEDEFDDEESGPATVVDFRPAWFEDEI